MGLARSLLDAGNLLPTSLRTALRKAADQSDLNTPNWALRSGHWYRHPLAVALGSHAPSAGTMFAVPLWLPKGTRTVQIAEWCVTLAAGSSRRGGFYFDDGNGYPGALEREFTGTLDTSSSAGWKPYPSYTAFDWPGLLWYAAVSQGGAPTMSGITAGIPWMSAGTSGVGNGNNLVSYQATGVTGALPDPFPTTLSISNGVGCPHFKIE